MKQQIKPNIKAHLLRGAFYLILLVAVCVIPFALSQRAITKQNTVATLPNIANPASGSWNNTGSRGTARDQHTATLLPNGNVLVAGGSDNSNVLASAELYDPLTGAWTTTGSLNTERVCHSATLLPDGTVLVAGGNDNNISTLASAELYNPSSGTWTTTGSLNAARVLHTATSLPNGKVLVAGGYNAATNTILASAELYDPATGTWTSTGSLNTARRDHTATLLSNGMVLVTGGIDRFFPFISLASAELYDPASGTWTSTGSLNTGRKYHTATLLSNGIVLVAGGDNYNGNLTSAELYDPATGTWATTGSLNTAREHHRATLLPSGNVLVAGSTGGSDPSVTSELYDASSGIWSTTAPLSTGRYFHTATLLPNGKVLVAGGYNDATSTVLASAEVYQPSCAPPPSGLVGWWPGDGNADDIIGGNNGILQGATFANGEVGQAFSFDGSDDQIVVPHNANQNTGNQITINAWVNPNSSGHGRPIAQKRSSSNVGGYTFETTYSPFGPDDGLQWAIWFGGTDQLLQTPANVLTNGTWQHVAATYDGAAMRIYVNGVEVASVAASGSIDPVSDAFVIGRNVTNTSFAWDGLIDEVQLFNRALSASEIQAIFNAGSSGECKSTPTPTPTATATSRATSTPTPTPAPTVQVTVQTTPTGLAFTVDGTPYSSTQTFTWASGSSHIIATTSPQSGGTGVQYVWMNWSGGGAISHTVAPTTNKTYTATFRTQYYLTMTHGTGGIVSPASGWRNAGSSVSISATPTNNTQASYRFDAWTGAGTVSYSGTNNPASITMNGPITENATFIQNPVQVTVQTNQAGLTFSVDGTTYNSAQTFSWDPGSSHTIATTSPQSGGTGVRYLWSNWSGGGAISHTVAPTTNKTYTATFKTQYYLTVTHNTGGIVSPASGWRASGSTVSITATPATNYHFTNWTGSGTGSFSGTSNPASITMGGPINETASFTHN
jgi:hypothetical protein